MSKVYRRRRWDDDDLSLPEATPVRHDGPRSAASPNGNRPDGDLPDGELPGGARWSGWAEADQRGPLPPPDWLITDGAALDHDRGVLKTGKEADVHLVERVGVDGASCLLAAKRYRGRDHRSFHRDAGYLEGRRVRRSREMRAMANRTEIGLGIIAGQWAAAEHRALGDLWRMGLPVPYPVQLDGTELLLEFIGEPDGTAAPRLAQVRPEPTELGALWVDLWASLTTLAEAGYAHGDLSAYNLLVHGGSVWLIDLPQLVDVVGNPQGPAFLRRDLANVAAWFAARGLPLDGESLADELAGRALRR